MLTWLFVGGLTYFLSMLFCRDAVKSFIAGILIGCFFAGVLLKLWRLSLALVGAISGFAIWLLFQSLFPAAISNPAATYLILSCVVVLCGALAVRLEKVALLICTPLLGGFFLLQGLEHFLKLGIGAFSLLSPQGARACQGSVACVGIYAGLIGACALGWWVQWRYTARNVVWSSSSSSKSKSTKESANAARRVKDVPELIVLSSSPRKGDKGFGNPFASRRNLYAPTTPEFYEG